MNLLAVHRRPQKYLGRDATPFSTPDHSPKIYSRYHSPLLDSERRSYSDSASGPLRAIY